MGLALVGTGETVRYWHINPLINALTGVAGGGEQIVLTQLSDASNYSVDIRNLDTTNSYGLRVRDASNNNLLLVYKNNIVLGASASADSIAINAGFTTALLLKTSDGAAIGSTAKMWSDLFLASGAVINFNAGDVTVTHAANALAFAGASSGYSFDGNILVTGVGTTIDTLVLATHDHTGVAGHGAQVASSSIVNTTFVTAVSGSSPISSSGGLTPSISIADVASGSKGAAPASGTPATNVYLRAAITTGAVSWAQVAYSDLSSAPTLPANTPAVGNQFVTAYNSSTGAFTQAQPTWANIDKSTSSIADITTRSHTALSDIGTNTHAQIDTHIAATGTSVHGLGTMSTQAASSIAVTGGTITGLTSLGIGVSPSQAIHIKTALPLIQYQDTGTNNSWTIGVAAANTFKIIEAANGRTVFWADTNGNTVLGTVGNDRLTIDSSGHVHIAVGYIELSEISAPTGATDKVRIYGVVGGDTKTDLCAIFQSGAAQIFAQEP